GIPNAIFAHRMGQDSMRFWWFGWRVWPLRSPRRHYFLFRNAVILMRRDYVLKVWKVWAAIKLLLTFWVTLAIGPHRREQISSMLRGIRGGLEFADSNHG
ncbi:MAG: glycosyltransferase family 2 protein, partial [Gammaproteobacteria bacterium]